MPSQTATLRLDAVPVRVLIDPLVTVLANLIEVLGPLRGRLAPAVTRAARQSAAGLDLRPLRFALEDRRGLMLTSMLHRWPPGPDLDDALAEPFTADLDRLVDFLVSSGWYAARPELYGEFVRRPRLAVAAYVDALDAYHRTVVTSLVPDLATRLRRAATSLAVYAGLGDNLGLFDLFRPPIPRHGIEIEVPGPVGEPELLYLAPMVASPRTCLSTPVQGEDRPAGAPDGYFIAAPTPNLCLTSTPCQAPESSLLPVLIGATRSRLLPLLTAPRTTSSLARQVGLAPSTVSEHLAALRSAGVVHASRRGGQVDYELTDLGYALLRLDQWLD